MDGQTNGWTDGRKKASHNISPDHSVHLADIIMCHVKQKVLSKNS